MTTPRTPSVLSKLAFGTSCTPHALLDVPLLFARVYAGYMIMGAGLDKLPRPEWMVDQVVQMGFPFPAFSASAACITEFVAGLLLITGLFTRFVALSLAIVMGFACFSFHERLPIVDFHITQFYFALFLAFFAVGGGRLSLDCAALHCSKRRAVPTFIVALVLGAAPLGYALYLELFTDPPTVASADDGLEAESVSLAGSFNEWSLQANPMVLDDASGLWSGAIDVETPGNVLFKFAANESWAINLGENDERDASAFPVSGVGEPDGGNITFIAPNPGRYFVTLDPTVFAYTIDRASTVE